GNGPILPGDLVVGGLEDALRLQFASSGRVTQSIRSRGLEQDDETFVVLMAAVIRPTTKMTMNRYTLLHFF
ncbi:hypothetical protein MMC31_008131, partial [Peltigera leucophlebia]|nr:hypothetical protein [Peltigera leucophlebia]